MAKTCAGGKNKRRRYRLETFSYEQALRKMGPEEIPGVSFVLAIFFRHARTMDVAPD
jgi:hypothetical protein